MAAVAGGRAGPHGHADHHAKLVPLALLALGIVFGDIGTSPLYALREGFTGPHAVSPTPGNVMGVLSLITWALVIVISIKYLVFVLRADNRGEGGIIALLALIHPEHRSPTGLAKGTRVALILLGIFGAALLYGDGMITPAISVLSAVEGLSIATHVFEPFVVPITIGILLGLFLVQKRGTAHVGRMFGPVTLIWFTVLAILGIRGIFLHPDVLAAVSPTYAIRFFMENGAAGFFVLGAVFLVVTGGEALYADMGHFGVRPIRLAWFALVLPSLLLNYFGQGALLLSDPAAVQNPFYLLAPRWALIPLVVLATAATIIASQAIISGVFSLTMQAVHLGYSPRLRIEHTSPTARGQIYMPEVNWILAAATIGLVIGFGSSSRLAGAYGIAVSLDMVITTLLAVVVAREIWGWSAAFVGAIAAGFLLVDVSFFLANVPKIPAGGWFPLVVAAIVFTLMTTWRRGRRILAQLLRSAHVPLDPFLEQVRAHPPVRVRGTAVFLTGNPGAAPSALLRNLEHNKVLHDKVVILTVLTEEVAHVREGERMTFENLGQGFYRVVARYGFMEDPSVPEVMELARLRGLDFDPEDTTYFLGREWLIPTKGPSGMAFWREKLFALMTRNAQPATAFFRIPPERVIEVGAQVKLETPGYVRRETVPGR